MAGLPAEASAHEKYQSKVETLAGLPAEASAQAGMVKLADIPDLGSGAARHGGSSPSTRTKSVYFFLFPSETRCRTKKRE